MFPVVQATSRDNTTPTCLILPTLEHMARFAFDFLPQQSNNMPKGGDESRESRPEVNP